MIHLAMVCMEYWEWLTLGCDFHTEVEQLFNRFWVPRDFTNLNLNTFWSGTGHKKGRTTNE